MCLKVINKQEIEERKQYIIGTKAEIRDVVNFIENRLVIDESFDSQYADIEKHLTEKSVACEKIKSYIDASMHYLSANGKRENYVNCVKLKLTHENQSAFFDVKQEICNFLENGKTVFTAYAEPEIYNYVVVDKEDLNVSIEELLRKRVEMYCRISASENDFVNMTVMYPVIEDLKNMAFDVKYKTNTDFDFEYEEDYEYKTFPKAHLKNYYFEIMINNETFKVRLNQIRSDDEESYFYYETTLDSIEKQNYLLD